MILHIVLYINPIELVDTSSVARMISLTNVTAMEITCNDGIIKLKTTLRMNQPHFSYNLTRKLGNNFELNDQIWMNATEIEWNVLASVSTRNVLFFNVSNSILKQPKNFSIGSNSKGVFDPFMTQMSYTTVKFHIEKILNSYTYFELKSYIYFFRLHKI